MDFGQLGKKLENPYAVTVMEQALDSIKSYNKAYAKSDFEVETTHLYLRFKPKNEEELNLLESDSTLALFEYPLDYEIPEGLTSYHDPSIPKDKPTFQYCAVPVDFILPAGIKVKVLEELYLPESNNLRANSGIGALLYDLEKEAFLMTGNEFDKEKLSDTQSRATNFYPSGTIKAFDNIATYTSSSTTRSFSHYECTNCQTEEPVDCPSGGLLGLSKSNAGKPPEPPEDDPNLCKRPVYTYSTSTNTSNLIPIEGAKVRARRWFTIKSTKTDKNGYFEFSHLFGGEVNYSIIWESSDWDIRDGNLTQAIYNGPKKSGSWNLNIEGGKSLRFATIHRACYRYHYQNIGGLKRPNVWTRLKINYNHKDVDTGINWGNNWQGFAGPIVSQFLPNIKIWGRKFENADYEMNEIFQTTIHELAHASHINLMVLDEINYMLVAKIIRESWAEAVQWYITKLEYSDRGIPNYNNLHINKYKTFIYDNKQEWKFDDSYDYTPIFIDLVDDYNQHLYYLGNNRVDYNRPNEDIKGYSMALIETNVLIRSYSLQDLLQLGLSENRPSEVSEQELINYISIYNN